MPPIQRRPSPHVPATTQPQPRIMKPTVCCVCEREDESKKEIVRIMVSNSGNKDIVLCICDRCKLPEDKTALLQKLQETITDILRDVA